MNLAERLEAGPLILMDGAMATELFKIGLAPGESSAAWNLSHPDKVRQVHEAYLAAGASCLLTNTFDGNTNNLKRYGLESSAGEILEAGVRLAREAAGPGNYVLASIGPGGDAYHGGWLASMIPHLRGADGILLETFSDIDAFWLVKYVCAPALAEKSIPVLLSITYERTDKGRLTTRGGQSADAIARMAVNYGIAALGVNCGRNMHLEDHAAVVKAYREVCALPIFVRPNAGTPVQDGSGFSYPNTPADFGSWATEMIRLGVRMLGGCCGTGPAHIAAMREVMDRWMRNEEVW